MPFRWFVGAKGCRDGTARGSQQSVDGNGCHHSR